MSRFERQGEDCIVSFHLSHLTDCKHVTWQYHRDFLHPLYPVYAYEFRALAPVGMEMGFDDLEVGASSYFSPFRFLQLLRPTLCNDPILIPPRVYSRFLPSFRFCNICSNTRPVRESETNAHPMFHRPLTATSLPRYPTAWAIPLRRCSGRCGMRCRR